jgi:hypothetical protein
MSDRQKLLNAVAFIRKYCEDHEIVGSMTLIGRKGMAENHLMFSAPWCKLLLVRDTPESTGLRLMMSKDDSKQDKADTMGALSILAQLMGETALSLIEVSQIMDREVGATHTKIYRDDPKPAA